MNREQGQSVRNRRSFGFSIFKKLKDSSLKLKLLLFLSLSVFFLLLVFQLLGARFFFWQGEKNEEFQFAYSAFEAYERVVYFFPNSSLASEARNRSRRILKECPDLKEYYLKHGLYLDVASGT